MTSEVKWYDASKLHETIMHLRSEKAASKSENTKLRSENKRLRASEEGALMILTQTIAERDAALAELRKAANRLEWCAGLLVQDESRQRAFEWVDEMRATIKDSRK